MSAISDYMDEHSLWWNQPSFDSRGQKPYENYDEQDMPSYLHDNIMAGTGALLETGSHILKDMMTQEALDATDRVPIVEQFRRWAEPEGTKLKEEYTHNYTPGTAG